MKSRAYIADVSTPELLTADDLLRLNVQDKRTELVRGRLIVREPPSFYHGVVAMRIGRRLAEFVETQRLGIVVAAETGFRLFSAPDTVRAPDVGFICASRIPDPIPRRGYASLAPDLAVEVLSPDDRPGEVLAKVADWLTAGSRLVWVIDPERRSARVCREDGSETLLGEEESLIGEDVLPGFACPLRQIL